MSESLESQLPLKGLCQTRRAGAKWLENKTGGVKTPAGSLILLPRRLEAKPNADQEVVRLVVFFYLIVTAPIIVNFYVGILNSFVAIA